METYYLIDFENVREYGLEGIQNLGDHEHIYLFYTNNANKISLDTIANIRAEFHAVKVAAGRQSLDMHLISFLGYIIGSSSEVNKFVIISDDKGFDSTAAFWNRNKLANVSRRKYITTNPKNPPKEVPAPALREAASEKKPEPAAEPEIVEAPIPEEVPVPEEIPAEPESHVLKLLKDNGVDGAHADCIDQIVKRNSESKTRKADIYREMLKKFGQKRGILYYGYIKKEI